MKRIEKLPPAFKRFQKMLGVLDFAVFEGASGSEEEILSAIPHALRHARTFNADTLQMLGSRSINEKTFFGDWYDYESGMLLKIGAYRTANGSELHDPKLKKLDRVTIVSGAAPCPLEGAGGQFAYAFSHPPYSLKGRPSEIQAVFEEIRDFILPPRLHSEILDWSNRQLPEVSDYFVAGMEWWGVFLFSIYVPETRQLTIVAGSTTD